MACKYLVMSLIALLCLNISTLSAAPTIFGGYSGINAGIRGGLGLGGARGIGGGIGFDLGTGYPTPAYAYSYGAYPYFQIQPYLSFGF